MNDTELRQKLKDVTDPVLGDDIVSLGLVEEATVEDGVAHVTVEFRTPYAPDEMEMGDAIRDAVAELGLDTELSVKPPRRNSASLVPEVENLVAVASGKGGVGKTTVSVNLAAALADRGARVGLLDGDVYGPNVPRMVGVEAEPSITADDTLVPPEAYGMKLMSMAFLIGEVDDPAMLRGPMIDKILVRLLEEVEWGRLDYLIVDMPPGTGDAQLTLLQNVEVTGSVMVTTPEDVAVDDVRKGVRMFESYSTPVLGVVENMTAFECPDCGGRHDLFGSDGGEVVAKEYELTHLGKIPMVPEIRSRNDKGAPPALDDGPASEAFEELADAVSNSVGVINRCVVADIEPDEIDRRDSPDVNDEEDGVGGLEISENADKD